MGFSYNEIKLLRIPEGKKNATYKVAPRLFLFIKYAPNWDGVARVTSVNCLEAYSVEWRYRYTSPTTKKQNTIKIESWPGTSHRDALAELKRLDAMVANGEDPAAERKKAAKLEALTRQIGAINGEANSLDNLFLKFSEDFDGSADTLKSYRLAFYKHVSPKFGQTPAGKFDPEAWEEHTLAIAKKAGKPGAGKNAHTVARRLLSYAVEKKVIPYNPLLGRALIVKATRLKPCADFLEADDIRRLLLEMEGRGFTPRMATLFNLMLRVGVRVEEWTRVRIGWIDFSTMCINHPGASMKNGDDAKTPLPGRAGEILVEWLQLYKQKWGALKPDWYLFPGQGGPTEKMSADAISSAAAERREGWVRFTPKMFRKTISTHLQRQGAPREVTKAIRNHKLATGVDAHYEFDQLYHFKIEWLEKWGKLLDELEVNPAALDTKRTLRASAKVSDAVANLFD